MKPSKVKKVDAEVMTRRANQQVLGERVIITTPSMLETISRRFNSHMISVIPVETISLDDVLEFRAILEEQR